MLAVAVSGCNTVAPAPVKQRQASFDSVPDEHGSLQNSGVLGFTNHLLIITPAAHARYTNLVARFGWKFTPPLASEAGVTPADAATCARFHAAALWLVDVPHVDLWATMNRWANNPQPKPP